MVITAKKRGWTPVIHSSTPAAFKGDSSEELCVCVRVCVVWGA